MHELYTVRLLLSFEVLAHTTLSVNCAYKNSKMALLRHAAFAKPNLKKAFSSHLRIFILNIFPHPIAILAATVIGDHRAAY